ncbi:cation-translocating P-type ATPase [Luteimicrobium sp. NPDC057192]|uniref:cation-translocating P-type ATPase n=1 Tax=Luteimicrobium sp. NPDC057192 TaxID=3346042 RepID=UPI00363A44E8
MDRASSVSTAQDAFPGLSQAEAAARLARDGPNSLPVVAGPSGAARFGRQLVHPFALLLWVAAGLGWLAGLPALTVAIVAVVLLNAVFAFAQEERASRAASRLRSLLPARVVVVRDGRRRDVAADEVVRGDHLVLEPGDRVPADGVVLDATALLVDTSTLTGESEPESPARGDALFAGTFVVEGLAQARAERTGARTRLAEIARATTQARRQPPPLTRELSRVVGRIGIIAVGTGLLFFVVTLLVGGDLSDGFVLAIGVTVALVPEALLPTVTLALAWGAERMARRHVLVRSFDAVETLGSTTFVCTDKTGTLTRNEMSVVETWTREGGAHVTGTGYEPDGTVDADGADARRATVLLAADAVRAGRGYVERSGTTWVPRGDPMEAAIDVLGRRVGLDTEVLRGASSVAFPFDPRRRRMSVAAGGRLITKGAPDTVLPRCADADAAEAAVDAMVGRGLRVLAVAARDLPPGPTRSADETETGLHLVGLVGLHDPPRDDVPEALASCRRAGVAVAVVTGDHPATARAIADRIGLRRADDPVVLADDLPADDAACAAFLDHDGLVVARVSPEDKLRIAQLLQHRGHVVAMTGDGVNDGPALHQADIGIAMGASGTDVAREAADLVLLDDRFSSIVAGIELGRATYANVRRFLTYHLSDNVAELAPFMVWGLSGGSLPLALGVLQVLALDIATDTASAVALGAEPAAAHVLDQPPASGRLLNGTVLRRAFGVLGPAEAVVALAAFAVTALLAGWRPGGGPPEPSVQAAASGATFLAIVLGQAANAYACRSATRTVPQLGWWTNRLLGPAVGLAVAVSLVSLLVPAIADVLGQAPPYPVGWALAASCAAAVTVADLTDKRWTRRRAGFRRRTARATERSSGAASPGRVA